jgi:hypothetical protein
MLQFWIRQALQPHECQLSRFTKKKLHGLLHPYHTILTPGEPFQLATTNSHHNTHTIKLSNTGQVNPGTRKTKLPNTDQVTFRQHANDAINGEEEER